MKRLKNISRIVIDEPIKITLTEVAHDLCTVLSRETVTDVFEEIKNSVTWITENHLNLPQGERFDYNADFGPLKMGYMGFWDRRTESHSVVIATFGWYRKGDMESGLLFDKSEMIRGIINGHLENKSFSK
jgi:hypothetical protein